VAVTHSGVNVPYQLHIWPATEARLELRNDDVTTTLEDERRLAILELDRAWLELAGATLEAGVPVHTAPDKTGTCALLPPLVPCMPNSTLEPTGIVLFQFNGTAV
jgi:hypothetical protein